MKKATLLMLGLILTTGVCYGAEHAPAAKMARPATAVMTMNAAQGTIESLKLAEPGKASKPEITLKEDSGSAVKFMLSHAVCFDSNAKPIALSQLKTGEKAKVQYFTNKEGVNEVKSLTLVK